MKKTLTRKQQEIAVAYVRQHIATCYRIGVAVENLERVQAEAEDLVLSGDITEADLKPVKFDIEESNRWKYQTYVTPIKESAIY